MAPGFIDVHSHSEQNTGARTIPTAESWFVDFVDTSPRFENSDRRNLRKIILGLTQREAKELGIGKSALHYLRRNALDGRPFKVYQKVVERLR